MREMTKIEMHIMYTELVKDKTVGKTNPATLLVLFSGSTNHD